MMNRRLRERLTEGEILQIFVDVCEGVAAMHNLQPPLLHRDLKVSYPTFVFDGRRMGFSAHLDTLHCTSYMLTLHR